MALLYRFVLLLVGAGALLLGVQVPGFVDQYQKRVDAHLIEVRANLQPFQDIANQFHQGSIESLIARHEASADPSFKAEGAAIQKMRDRVQRFENQMKGIEGSLAQQVQWLVLHGDRELIDETRKDYSFAVLLNRTAVIAGLGAMVAAIVLLELLAALVRLVLPPPQPRYRS